MNAALKILNQIEPNGELLDTDKAIEAMGAYKDHVLKQVKEEIEKVSQKYVTAFDVYGNRNPQHVKKDCLEIISKHISE